MSLWAVKLEKVASNRTTVDYDNIETGCSLTMTVEAWEHAGRPATVTILVDGDELSRPAKLSNGAEPVSDDD